MFMFICIMNPINKNTSISNEFDSISLNSCSVSFLDMFIIENMNPSTATASTPFPPRFSASMKDSSAAHIIIRPDVCCENFFIPLKNIIPTIIPAPIPTSICVSTADMCACIVIVVFVCIWFNTSSNMNGISTIIGVLIIPSIFRNSNTLFVLWFDSMNTDAGSVPDIIAENISA